MVLEKLITVNPLFNVIVGGTIQEYDIRNAGASAIYELKGQRNYDDLMRMSKQDRNVTIGLMQRDEPGLSEKVNECMLKYLNTFLIENNIRSSNFIYSTRDSIFIYNKIPMKLKFGHVEFRNKEGTFGSMFTIKNFRLFFDSMRDKILCKGIADSTIEKSIFLNEFIKKYLYMIETTYGNDVGMMRLFSNMREDYINSDDRRIYRELFNENMYRVNSPSGEVFIDNEFEEADDFKIVKEGNYVDIVMPLMRCTNN